MKTSTRIFISLSVGVILVGLAIALTSCGTVHQQTIAPKVSAVGFSPIKVAGGRLIDADTRDRYNGLIEVYGSAKFENGAPVFIPALKKDQGLAERGGLYWFQADSSTVLMAKLEAMRDMAFPVK